MIINTLLTVLPLVYSRDNLWQSSEFQVSMSLGCGRKPGHCFHTVTERMCRFQGVQDRSQLAGVQGKTTSWCTTAPPASFQTRFLTPFLCDDSKPVKSRLLYHCNIIEYRAIQHRNKPFNLLYLCWPWCQCKLHICLQIIYITPFPTHSCLI